MTSPAVDLLREIEAKGGTVRAEGERLKVRAPRPLPAELIEQLKAAKPEILKFLQKPTWDASDWRDWIAERAAILEYDGGLSRTEADRRAYEHALTEWQNRHPPHADPGRCAGCGGAIDEQGNDWRSLGDGAVVHYGGQWGLRCLDRHGVKRHAEAVAALAALGVPGGEIGSDERLEKTDRRA